jgi:hypothetical protein
MRVITNPRSINSVNGAGKTPQKIKGMANIEVGI